VFLPNWVHEFLLVQNYKWIPFPMKVVLKQPRPLPSDAAPTPCHLDHSIISSSRERDTADDAENHYATQSPCSTAPAAEKCRLRMTGLKVQAVTGGHQVRTFLVSAPRFCRPGRWNVHHYQSSRTNVCSSDRDSSVTY
jgi:hypothetical protein